jgi:DNA-binding transcriptional MerR regulator
MLMDKIAKQFYKIYIEYIDKKDFFLLPIDSEIFQLKMMICSKLKIYEHSKLIILLKGEIISILEEKTAVSDIFQSHEEEINLIICLDNNLLNTEGVERNKLTIKSENLSNPADTISSNQNTDILNNIKPNNNNNLKINDTNYNINNFNNIHNKNNISSININNGISLSKKAENLFYKICGCNMKNEALNVCFACCSFICESCKRREPHFSHAKNVIRVSKAQDYVKAFAKDFAEKLKQNIISEESYLQSQNFNKRYLHSLKAIELKYSGLKESLFNLKNNQIAYLNEIKQKLKFKENFSDANFNLEEIKKHIDSIDEGNKDLDFQVSLRKRLVRDFEVLERKMNLMKKHLFFYLKSHKEIKAFNKSLNANLKEFRFHTQTEYSGVMVNTKLANFVKGSLNKQKKITNKFYFSFIFL